MRPTADTTLERFEAVTPGGKVRLAVANQERFSLGVFPVSEHELPHEQVKRGAKVVDRISNAERQALGQLRMDADAPLLAAMLAAKLRVGLFDDFIWVVCQEAGDFSLDVRDVLLGSPYFQLWTV